MAQEMEIFIEVAPARDVTGAKFTEHFVFLTETVTGEGEGWVRDVCESLSLHSPLSSPLLSLVIFTWQLTACLTAVSIPITLV